MPIYVETERNPNPAGSDTAVRPRLPPPQQHTRAFHSEKQRERCFNGAHSAGRERRDSSHQRDAVGNGDATRSIRR